jgi:hypothetical protein
MTSIIARIALPIVSAGIFGGAALGLAGMASAQTTTVENSTGTAIVASPDTYAKPAPTSKPGWHNHKGMGHSYLFTQ